MSLSGRFWTPTIRSRAVRARGQRLCAAIESLGGQTVTWGRLASSATSVRDCTGPRGPRAVRGLAAYPRGFPGECSVNVDALFLRRGSSVPNRSRECRRGLLGEPVPAHNGRVRRFPEEWVRTTRRDRPVLHGQAEAVLTRPSPYTGPGCSWKMVPGADHRAESMSLIVAAAEVLL